MLHEVLNSVFLFHMFALACTLNARSSLFSGSAVIPRSSLARYNIWRPTFKELMQIKCTLLMVLRNKSLMKIVGYLITRTPLNLLTNSYLDPSKSEFEAKISKFTLPYACMNEI